MTISNYTHNNKKKGVIMFRPTHSKKQSKKNFPNKNQEQSSEYIKEYPHGGNVLGKLKTTPRILF